MKEYFKNKFGRWREKLARRRKRVDALEEAIDDARKNKKRLNVSLLKRNMSQSVATEKELEAVVAKYDLDGDRVLNEVEMEAMQKDLDRQEKAMDQEEEDMEKKEKEAMAEHRERRGSLRFHGHSGSYENVESNPAFKSLTKRVGRVEHAIGSIVSKIDALLIKLEAIEA